MWVDDSVQVGPFGSMTLGSGSVPVTQLHKSSVTALCISVYLFPRISVSFVCMWEKFFRQARGPWWWFVH